VNPSAISSDAFLNAVAAAIDGGCLLEPGCPVVVGVSGGADSVALLAALRELSTAPGRGYRLIVAHLHHGLRGEADQEQQFVEHLTARWGLQCQTARCDVRDEAFRCREGIESTARRLRYAFLRDVARQRGAGRVAVGHQADDQVETVLFHLFRGCHLRGAAGMRPSRPLGDGVTLVRPLLGLRRADTEAYCRAQRLAWCRDASNMDPAFQRNVLRNEVLPLLRRFNPQTDQAVLDLAAAAAQAEDHLQGLGEKLLDRAVAGAGGALDLATLAGESPLVRRYALRMALERAGAPMGAVTAAHLRALAAMATPAGARAMDLPGGWSVRVEGRSLVVVPPQARSSGPVAWPAVTLACPGRTALPDGRAVVCDLGPVDREALRAHWRTGRHDVEWLDADAIEGPLLCRPRQRGDAFRPLGCGGRRKVGDVLTDLKLPAAVRRGVLCVSDRAGIVVCLPVRPDERVKVTDATTRVLRIGVLDGGR
jgi:tRNA(Ile)-lysidine synthase